MLNPTRSPKVKASFPNLGYVGIHVCEKESKQHSVHLPRCFIIVTFLTPKPLLLTLKIHSGAKHDYALTMI